MPGKYLLRHGLQGICWHEMIGCPSSCTGRVDWLYYCTATVDRNVVNTKGCTEPHQHHLTRLILSLNRMQRRQTAVLNNLHGTTRQLEGVTNGAKVFPKLLDTALTLVIASKSVNSHEAYRQ